MGKGKLLIIDDELHICTSLQKLLTDAGYEVDYRTSGKAGFDAVMAGEYDVIFLDIKMPDADGIAVLSEIKNVDANAIVIMITAYPSNETIDAALRKHAYDYINKPIDTDKILFVIERAVSYRRLLQQMKKSS